MALRTTGMSSAAGTADNPFGGGGGGSQSTALTLSNQSQPMGGVMGTTQRQQDPRRVDADAQL